MSMISFEIKGQETTYVVTDQKLGSGSIGIVYKGYDKQTQECVAIKVIQRKQQMNQQENKYYEQEIKLSEVLKNSEQHENIIKIIDIIKDEKEEEDTVYIVQEYCNEGDLFKFQQHTEFDLITKILFIFQIALGLQYLHKKHIIHRDLKPENILICKFFEFNQHPKYCVKIGDYGVSKQLDDTLITKSQVGTLQYMAPELLKLNCSYSLSADIWSFGCVIYEIITNKQLIEGDRQQIIQKIKNFQETDLDIQNYCQDQDIIDLLKQILQQMPDDRKKIDQIVDQLNQILLNHNIDINQSSEQFSEIIYLKLKKENLSKQTFLNLTYSEQSCQISTTIGQNSISSKEEQDLQYIDKMFGGKGKAISQIVKINVTDGKIQNCSEIYLQYQTKQKNDESTRNTNIIQNQQIPVLQDKSNQIVTPHRQMNQLKQEQNIIKSESQSQMLKVQQINKNQNLIKEISVFLIDFGCLQFFVSRDKDYECTKIQLNSDLDPIKQNKNEIAYSINYLMSVIVINKLDPSPNSYLQEFEKLFMYAMQNNNQIKNNHLENINYFNLFSSNESCSQKFQYLFEFLYKYKHVLRLMDTAQLQNSIKPVKKTNLLEFFKANNDNEIKQNEIEQNEIKQKEIDTQKKNNLLKENNIFKENILECLKTKNNKVIQEEVLIKQIQQIIQVNENISVGHSKTKHNYVEFLKIIYLKPHGNTLSTLH